MSWPDFMAGFAIGFAVMCVWSTVVMNREHGEWQRLFDQLIELLRHNRDDDQC